MGNPESGTGGGERSAVYFSQLAQTDQSEELRLLRQQRLLLATRGGPAAFPLNQIMFLIAAVVIAVVVQFQLHDGVLEPNVVAMGFVVGVINCFALVAALFLHRARLRRLAQLLGEPEPRSGRVIYE